MKKDEKPDTLAVIDNYRQTYTHIHTYGHGDSMTNPAQRTESVKIYEEAWRIYSKLDFHSYNVVFAIVCKKDNCKQV